MDQTTENMIRRHLTQLRKEQAELKTTLKGVKEQIEYWELQLEPTPKRIVDSKSVTKDILTIIEVLVDEAGQANIDEIVTMSKCLNIDSDLAVAATKHLKQMGEIYEPSPGVLKRL